MKSRYLIISTLALLLLLGVGYFFFQQNFNRQKADVWSFVPEHAVLIYESEEAPAAWETMVQQPAGEILRALPWFARMEANRRQLDSVYADLELVLEKRQVHASLHITENNNFDYLFYIPLKGVADYNALKEVLDAYQKEDSYRFSKRIFHDVEIQEFTHVQQGGRFSYFLYDNILVASFTPFLVEDAIRQLEAVRSEQAGFRRQHSKIFQLTHIEDDQGNLYVNGSRLGAFMNIFLKESYFLPSFPYASKLDMAINQDGILMNGYTVVENGAGEPYLQSLLGEKPQALAIAHMVPLRTAYLKFLGFGDGNRWHQRLLKQQALPGWETLKAGNPAIQELPSLLGNRIALAGIPVPGEENQHQLLYIHTSDGEKAAEQLKAVVLRMNKAKGDSLFQEEFGGTLITHIPYQEFPAALFGPAFAGFEECFYLKHQNYLVLSNSIQELKAMMLDMEAENTWQKSVPLYQFLEKTNQEVNFGLYVNTDRMWRILVRKAEPEWKGFMEKFGAYLRQFNMMALQFSTLDGMLYTNFLLQASPRDVQDVRRLRFSVLHETLLESPVAGKPMLVRDPRRKSRHILVQDTLHKLYLMDIQGKLLKSDSLDAPLVSEVFLLDPRKNHQIEQLLATKQSLYLYDPTFQLRPPYPVAVPGNAPVEWANVIDYNGSKVYRTLLATTLGDLYMFDLQGKNLEGWQPKKLGGPLSSPPGHIRVRGKDCIYAFRKNGLMNLLNRRGESYDGFPLNLKDSVAGPVHIKQGTDFKNTLFTTVTKGGELISFNLEGAITHQAQLFKPDINSFFMLVQDQSAASFLIVRQSRNRLSLLDTKGSLLFEKDYLAAAEVQLQYFNFGADKELIAVTDPVEAFTYLYDLEGNLLNLEPLNSCCPVSIEHPGEVANLTVFKAYEDKVSILRGQE